jgi:ferredoxin
MGVLINFKICDNSADCGGISACPSGAFYFCEIDRTIKIDNDKCVGCGACEQSCPVGAIRFARDMAEHDRIKGEIDADERTTEDLFAERYASQPLDDAFVITPDRVAKRIKSAKPTVIEVNQYATIECLLKSVRATDICGAFHRDAMYAKCYVEKGDFEKLGITSTPILRFYYKGKTVGEIDQYFTKDQQDKYLDIIRGFGRKL